MPVTVGEVQGKLSLDSSNFDSGLKSAEGKFDSFGSSLTNKATALGMGIAKTLAVGVAATGAALVGVAAVGTKSYMDIESAAADAASKMDLGAIAQQSGITMDAAFTSTKQHVIDLSRELGQLSTNSFDPTQIAGAMANLAAGGFDVAKASAADLAPILSLATAANYDLASSAEVSLSTMNMYGLQMQDLGHISDVYTVAAGKSAAGMEDFKETMSYVGPVSKNANVSLEESVAMIGKLRDIGIPASTVGTSLRDGMQTLIAPTGAAAKALEAMGLSTSDVSLKNQDFIDVLAKMKAQADKTGEGAAAFIRVFGVTGDTLYNLAGMAPEVDKLTESLENSKGAAEKMAGLMNDTLKGAFNTAMGSAVDLAIGIGESLKPALIDTFKWFSDTGAPAIQAFIDAIKNGDWASVGNMISEGFNFAVAKLANLGDTIWTFIEPGLQLLKDKVGPTIAEAFTFTLEMSGLAAVGVGIATLASGIVASLSDMSIQSIKIWATTKAKSLASVTSMVASTISNYAKMAASSLLSMTGMAGKTAIGFAGMLASSISSTISMVAGVLAGYASMAIGAAASVASIVATTVGGFVSVAATVAAPIALIVAGLAGIGVALNPEKYTEWGKVASQAFIGLESVVSDCWKLIQEGDFSGVVDRLKKAFEDAVQAVKEIDWNALGKEFMEMVSDGAKATIDSTLKLADWIKETLDKWISEKGPENLGKSVSEALINGMKSLFGSNKDSSLTDMIEKSLGTVSDWMKIGLDIAKGIGSGIFDALQPYIDDAYNSILIFVGDAGSTIITWKIDVMNAITEIYNTITGAFMTAFEDFKGKFAFVNFGDSWKEVENFFESLAKSLTKLSSMDPAAVIDAVASLFNTDWGSYLPGGSNQKLTTKSADPAIASIVTYTGKTASNTEKATFQNGEIITWKKRSTENEIQHTQKIINSLGEQGYKLGDIANVGKKQIDAITGGSKLTTLAIQSVKSSMDVNNGVVNRKFDELTTEQKASGKWFYGTLEEAKKGVEQQKVTADNTKSIDTNTKDTSTNTKDTATNTKATEEAVKQTGIQEKVKWTNPETGKVEERYPEDIKWQEWVIAQKRIIDYGEDKAKDEAEIGIEGEKTEAKIGIETAKDTSLKSNEASEWMSSKLKGTAFDIATQLTTPFATTIPAAVAAMNANSNAVLLGGSQIAANALQIGAQIGGQFTQDGGNAVKIGLTEAGKEIAVIGKTTQDEWTKGGKTLYTSIDGAVNKFSVSVTSSGSSLINAATESKNIKLSGANAAAFVEKTTANQKNAIEISTANQKRNLELAGSTSLKSDVMGAGRTFSTTVVSGAASAASTLASFVQNINGGRNLKPIWAAKGAHLKQPTAVLAGEAGEELILPSKLTNMFVNLAENYQIQKPSLSGVVAAIPRSNVNDIRENLTLTANLILDGKKVASVVLPNMKKELTRAGMKRS